MVEVTITTMIGLITVIALVMVNHVLSNVPWFRLCNPGISFPFLGHIHKFFTKEMGAEAPEEWGDVDEELQNGHSVSVGRRL